MQYIDTVVYINLYIRTDRNDHIINELKLWKDLDWSKVHRFSAIEGKLVGCLSSHLSVLKLAREKKWENVLVLEDDFTWEDWVIKDEKINTLLSDFWIKHHHEFGFIQLAHGMTATTHAHEFTMHANEPIASVKYATNAAGYWVHERCYDALIQEFEKAVDPLYLTGAHWLYLNDVVWNTIRPFFPTFAFIPRLGYQYGNYSDLSECYQPPR
jgi:GR25 family glycosyltransferase involved in LPS biosynthesis